VFHDCDSWPVPASGEGHLRLAGKVGVVALLVLGSVFLAEPQAKPKSKSKPNINRLKGTLRTVKTQKTQAARELNKTRKQVRVVKGDIASLDARLEKLEGELETTTNRLVVSQKMQKITAVELEQATQRLSKTTEQVRKRLRWMYIQRDQNVASVLLGSQSMGDFASRTFLLQRIAQADRELFEKFKSERREVGAKKVRIDNLVRKIANLQANQKRQQYDLSETKEDKRYLLGKLRDKQQDLEKLVRQLDAEENAIAASIQAYYARQSGAGGVKLPPFSGRFAMPVNARITSGYGMRFHPILKRQRLHTGIDFGARHGTPIRAAADGVVISARYTGGYGNTVIIDHGSGISTLYAHASRLLVKSGQRVKKGQTIAAVGSTGLSTGPHLHWEVRVNGRPVNPRSRL
jgi:murein DD-endopeptidase MepM/ murein hydrolase activator NlpD